MASTPINSANSNAAPHNSWWDDQEDFPSAQNQEDFFQTSSASNWAPNNLLWEQSMQSSSFFPATPEHDAFAEESEACATPKRESKAPAGPNFVTPEKLKTALHVFKNGNYTLFSPVSKDKAKIEAGLDCMHKMPTPQKKRKAERILDEVISQLAPEVDPCSVKFHEKAEEALQEGISGTAKKMIRTSCGILNESPSRRIVPLGHLTKRSKTGGFHLDLGNGDHTITPIAENPLTKIRYVRVDDTKNSTLFPIGTTTEQVIELVSTAEKIAKQENRSLRKTSEGYVIECYVDSTKGGIAFSSTFPLFFFAEFSEDKSYDLTDNFSISSKDVLEAAISENAESKYCTYNDIGQLERVFIDIAPIFKEQTGVDKGIIIQFDASSAPDLFTHYKQYREDIFYKD